MVLGRWVHDPESNEYYVSLEEIVLPGDDAVFEEYALNFGGKIKLKVLEQLRKLRREGYKLWLDDFGSGYSSLNMFSRYDFNLIKFDMELLRNLNDHNGANRRIIKAMIDVARGLGIHTLVEGMETEEQRQFLREVGCELAQGFLFHRPEPLASILFRRQSGHKSGPCETPEEREALIRKWIEM